MKKSNRTFGKLSLNKLQVTSLNNMKLIKGGRRRVSGIADGDEDDSFTIPTWGQD